MTNPGVMYRVTGRYMNGQKIVAYHLVGDDGSQSCEKKKRVIWLIGKGLIYNMRIQTDAEGEIIIRGKGVNLNNLPVYDINKGKYRDTESSQAVANTNVPIKKSNINPMGQYTIKKRIMFKNRCLGYELQDCSGLVVRKSREDVIKLAVQELISNAVVQRYSREGSNKAELTLRGAGCELNKLPILIVISNGKIVDPNSERNELTVRAAYMKHSGIVHDSINNTKIPFKAGDFIVCGANGNISIKNRNLVDSTYVKDTESENAVCDDYLVNSQNYYVEVFGSKPVQLNPKIIKSWVIMKPVVNK